MRDTFARTVYEVAKSETGIFVVVADISPAASMAPFREEFPERFYNVGVSEQSMISICTGLALRGCNPFAYTIAPFTVYRPFEHIRVELCYQELPVTLVGVGAGASYSVSGATHNAIEDIAVMSALPNMTVLAPCDPEEVKSCVWASARHAGPVYLRLGKAGEPVLTADAPEPFELGKVRKVKDGEGIAFVGYGPILSMAFDAAKKHEAVTGEKVAIYSAHTVKPLDENKIREIFDSFDRVVVLEETTPFGCLAGRLKEIAWDSGSKCLIRTVGLKDMFIKCYGTSADLLAAHGITMERVLAEMKN